MKIKVTLERADSTTADVVVTTSASSPIGDVAAFLARADPAASLHRATDSLHSPTEWTLAIRRDGHAEHDVLSPSRAIGEANIGSGARVILVDLGTSTVGAQADVGVVLTVVDGVDRGARFTVHTASSHIGRDRSCEVILSDPMVSKRHARMEIEADSLTLVDDNSANGILVDGGEVARVRLTAGARFTIGGSVLEVEQFLGQAPPEAMERAAGAITFTRAPRVESRFPGEKVEAPAIPTDDSGQGFPFILMVMPLILGAVLYLVTQSLLSVVFVALSPLLILGNYLSTRADRARTRRRNLAQFEDELAKLRERLATLALDEGRARRAEVPSVADVVAAAEQKSSLLWTRRPEHWSFLTLHLGLGIVKSRSEIAVRGSNDRGMPGLEARVDEIRQQYSHVADVPVFEALDVSGGIGVCGSTEVAISYVRGLVAQVAGLHSPAEVVLCAIVEPRLAPGFEWLKWLPHTSSAQSPVLGPTLADSPASATSLVAELEALIETRTPPNAVASPARLPPLNQEGTAEERARTAGTSTMPELQTPAIVLLVIGEPPVERARLVQMLERAVKVGIHPIWLSSDRAGIPALCRTFIKVAGDGSVTDAGFVREGRASTLTRIEGLDPHRAQRFALSLSPVVDVGALSNDESDLPPSVTFLSLIGHEAALDPDAVIDRWRQNESIVDRHAGPIPRRRTGTLRALVGQSGSDAMHLDLRRQGPHALVGGTTGSGKSEFLQAWVLGMAAEYSPDRVTFLFVDYKGGAAFADCIHLPHAVGLVTDLNPHLVRRALTSLRAELRHREHLLNRLKAKDLLELERRGDPACPPALIIVIDEFAALSGDIPEFVDGVVDVAQRGRSLGIHLIMATQRPAGVIRDNLRANTNLRIALRMADESDSSDVVGSTIAANFDPTIPGRAVARTGPERLAMFQSAYAGGWTTATSEESVVDIQSLGFGPGTTWSVPNLNDAVLPASEGPTDIGRLVSNFRDAAERASIIEPRRPWLDELAPIYDLSRLRQRTDSELILGVADDPREQSQHPVYFYPDMDGHLAVYGAGGSGKTTVLRTIAIAAGITPRGGPAHVYAMDFAAGGLRALTSLPHVGAVISGDDAERIERLLRWLRGVIDDRVERWARVHAGSLTEYRRLADHADEARIIVLVDGMATFRQEYEYSSNGQLFAMFQQILADGRQVGVHMIVSADRPGSVSPAIASALQRRVVLRLTDDNDYLLLDTAADVISPASPPGRAVVDGLETQVALLGGTRNPAEQGRAIDALASTLEAAKRTAPTAIERLATDIPLSSLPSMQAQVAIGIADRDLSAIGIDPAGALILSGPPQSGRTTAATMLVHALRNALPSASFSYFGNPRSPIGMLDLWNTKAIDLETAAAAARTLLPALSVPAVEEKHIIIIESIADFLGGIADADLTALIKAAKRNNHFVIAEAETSSWSQSWPLLVEMKSARRGLALQPDQMEGDLIFKTSFPRARRNDFPPGRGYLVEGGRVRKVQLAYAE